MVKSATDDNTRTVPLKPLPFKIIGMGSISVTDNDFLAWRDEHRPGLGSRDAMVEYVRHINGQNKDLFDEQMEQWKMYMRSRLPPHQRKELEGLRENVNELKASVSAQKDVLKELGQTIILTPQNTTQNILSLQIIPNSQNISSLPEQSPPQSNSSHPSLEQSPSQNIPPPSDEQMTDSARTERAASPVVIDANNLTMQQALDLFELLQAR